MHAHTYTHACTHTHNTCIHARTQARTRAHTGMDDRDKNDNDEIETGALEALFEQTRFEGSFERDQEVKSSN